MRHIKEGIGWRLGFDPDADIFKGLVAGDRWAIEMTQAEFADFSRLALQLAATLKAMSKELMSEERIVCEQETSTIWLEVEGFPHQYSLRFMLLQGRQAEGGWPDDVSGQVMRALPALTLF